MVHLSSYGRYKAEWGTCNQCALCRGRKHVVLLRGNVPCEALLIGEAPGESEDVLGAPFVGPAGKLLDEIIAASGLSNYRLAWTNIIACIPRDDEGNKLIQPPKFAIEACKPRLQQCLEVCQPFAVIWVGQIAAKWGPKLLNDLPSHRVHDLLPQKCVEIIHPSAILHMLPVQRSLAARRAEIGLREVASYLQTLVDA